MASLPCGLVRHHLPEAANCAPTAKARFMAVLSVTSLVKRFGTKVAVNGLSMEVGGGEVVGLLGPNGAGKSTTFMCLGGLLRPDSGAIALDGVALGPDRGRSIALIPETPEVYAMLTVWEHLVFVARSCKLANGWEERAADLLARFDMLQHRDEVGQALSKGMRQKTLVAATVLANTPVVLLDEPMIGLDPLGQRELRQIIADLRTTGIVVMISTHMLEQAQAICDRVIIMKEGREIAGGTFAELHERSGETGSAEDVFLELTR
ncbi:MAG: ABC transporter ATP-binding protein [Candidatus Eremiobacteraeota bacterium]|nr:ABC transporter ATP-binding protein [Candidatus Eremiobacteraeota bacterium]